MKSAHEMIAVIQAYERGDKVECKTLDIEDCDWVEIKDPQWDWYHLDYRLKPIPRYVPFDSAEEFLAAQRVHSTILLCNSVERHSSGIDCYCNVILVNMRTMVSYDADFKYIFTYFKFQDGTPCGKEVIDE